jgi:hypothetical protein
MKLSRLFLKHLIIYCVIFFCCSNANAQLNPMSNSDTVKENSNPKLEINMEANYMQHYIWRAISFGSDNVSQPMISFTYGKAFLTLTSNFNLDPKNLSDELYSKQTIFDEQDVEIGFTGAIKKLDYIVKASRYTYFFQPTSPSTSEFNVYLSHPLYKGISVFSENVFDLEAYNSAYYNNAGLAWEYTRGKTDFALQASLGMGNAKFNASYFGGEKGGLMYYASKAEITQNFKRLYLKIMGEYNIYATNEIKASSERNNTSNFAIIIGKDFSINLFKHKKGKK